MSERTKFLIHARRLHNALRHAIENMDVSPEKLSTERPLFEHFASGMYLAGCLAFLEGKYGAQPWLHPSLQHQTFDQFLQQLPQKQADVFSTAGVSQNGIEALVCIRNALTHNAGDIARNKDRSCLAKVNAVLIPGVVVTGSEIILTSSVNLDFMEYVRKCMIAISMFHGDG
jgi:hypothetical protein